MWMYRSNRCSKLTSIVCVSTNRWLVFPFPLTPTLHSGQALCLLLLAAGFAKDFNWPKCGQSDSGGQCHGTWLWKNDLIGGVYWSNQILDQCSSQVVELRSTAIPLLFCCFTQWYQGLLGAVKAKVTCCCYSTCVNRIESRGTDSFLESSLALLDYFEPPWTLFALIGKDQHLELFRFQVYNAPGLFQSWLALRLSAFVDVDQLEAIPLLDAVLQQQDCKCSKQS